MIEWERIADSEPWGGEYISSARLKVYGGWLVQTTVENDGRAQGYCVQTFVPDPHQFWKIEND